MNIAIVTGGSRGIGAAVAKELAAAGFGVVVGYNANEEKALAVERAIRGAGGEAWACRADVSDSAACDALVAKTVARYGRVDVLVNAAGIAAFAPLLDCSDDTWARLFAVNASGTFYMCRAAAREMVKTHSGAIINLTSIWGEVGASCESAYSACKGAVIAFTKAIAKELAPSGIRANCISPGFIDTEMNAALSADDRAAIVADTPLGRAGTPEDVAALAAFLAKDTFMTGQVLRTDGGFVNC